MYYIATLLTRENETTYLRRATRRTVGTPTIVEGDSPDERENLCENDALMLILFGMLSSRVTM